MGIFKELRRRLRDAAKLKRLSIESQRYHACFESVRGYIPGDEEIRAKIARRFSRNLTRPKGSLNVLAIYHSYNWEEPSLGPSLAAFGKVSHIDWLDPGLAGGKHPRDAQWQQQMNAGLLKRAAEWNAEKQFNVIFTYLSGEQVTPPALDTLRSLGAPIVNLALNDKEAFVGKERKGYASGMRDICSRFDLCWTSTFDAVEKYVVEGAYPIYLPEGANPYVHRPYEEKKVLDVSFVGQCYGNRPGVVKSLRDAGIRVETFGPGWPNGPLSTEEMVRTWSRSRINLGFGGVQGHKETFCLKGRDFEVPMGGGLYLTEHHEELAPFYDIGREIVTYTDFDDLLAKIRWLLANPVEAESIRRAGRERALKEHTWEMRFERSFRVMGVIA